jgi:outer membrane murein-binding lipoprotein Lpp
VTKERLSEIRESLNSVQRVHDPWPSVVQELFDEVARLRPMLDTANALIGEAAEEAKRLQDRIDELEARKCERCLANGFG